MATVATTREDRLIRVDAPPLGHIPAFDGFRGIFVLMVVTYHAGLTTFFHGMPVVIDWFFVSSGFLITSLMLDEQNKRETVSLRNFYTRRVLRLFPAMYAFLLAFSVLAIIASFLVAEPEEFSNWWVDALAGATYTYNIVAAANPEAVTVAIGHIWSLTVEEQFYFLWPLILVAVLRKGRRRSDMRLIVGSVIFVAAFFFIRFHFQYMVTETSGEVVKFADQDDPTWQGFVYRFASMRPDMIVYGCLIAFLTRRIPRPTPSWFLRFLAIAGPLSWIWFLAVLFLGNTGLWGFDLWGGPAYQLALLALGPAVLDTFFRPETRYTRALTWKPISWLGVRAYGIYLWHVLPLLLLLPIAEGLYGAPRLAVGVIGSVLGVLAGLGSFYFVERRFLRMKERFAGVPSPPGRPDGLGSTSSPAAASQEAPAEVGPPGEAPSDEGQSLERPSGEDPRADSSGQQQAAEESATNGAPRHEPPRHGSRLSGGRHGSPRDGAAEQDPRQNGVTPDGAFQDDLPADGATEVDPTQDVPAGHTARTPVRGAADRAGERTSAEVREGSS